MKKTSFAISLFGCMLMIVSASICFSSNNPVDVRTMILDQLKPLEFEKVISLNLGPGSMLFVRGFVNLADEDDEAANVLSGVREVKIGVYESTEPGSAVGSFNGIRSRLEEAGWELFVKAQETDEYVYIFYQLDDDDIDSMLVVVMDASDLVIVELGGDLERIIQESIKDPHTISF